MLQALVFINNLSNSLIQKVEAFDEGFVVLMKTLLVGGVGGGVVYLVPWAGILIIPAITFVFIFLTLTGAQ